MNGDLVLAGQGQSLYRSTNQGASFSWVSMCCGSINKIMEHDNYILLLNNSSLKKSTNSGASWTDVGTGLFGSYLGMEKIGNDIYVSSTAGLYKSTDGGNNFSLITLPENSLPDIYSFPYMTTYLDNLVLGFERTLYFYNTTTGNFVNVSTNSALPKLNSYINGISFYEGAKYIAVGNSGLYKTTGDGSKWEMIKSGAPIALQLMNNQYWVIRESGTLFISTDEGASWTELPSTAGKSPKRTLNIGSKLYFVLNDGIYTSVNSGETITKIFNFTQSIGLDLVIKNQTLFVKTQNGVKKSENDGGTWVDYREGLPVGDTRFLSNSGNYLFTAVNGVLYRRDLSGTSWEEVTGAPSQLGILESNNNQIVASSFYNVYFSENYGDTWEDITDGFSIIQGIPYFHNDSLWVTFSQHLLVRRMPSENTTGTATVSEIFPENNVRIYPNPTSGKLSVRSAKASHLNSVKVFDITGKEYMIKAVYTPTGADIEVLDLELKGGLYYLQLSSKEGIESIPFIIK